MSRITLQPPSPKGYCCACFVRVWNFGSFRVGEHKVNVSRSEIKFLQRVVRGNREMKQRAARQYCVRSSEIHILPRPITVKKSKSTRWPSRVARMGWIDGKLILDCNFDWYICRSPLQNKQWSTCHCTVCILTDTNLNFIIIIIWSHLML
jgi:hypothetical protein